ncbi:MAG: hypothetical protein QM757_46860 [Paludibaculum sp.]
MAVSNPDGLTTAPSSFQVMEAKPKISSVAPGALAAGVSGLVVTVDGSGYLPGALLKWEGAPLETSFLDPTRLTAQVPPDLMVNSGSARVTAVNPQDQTSEPWLLKILGLSVLGFDQQHLVAGGPDTTLKVFGNGFQPGATIYWNGAPLSTTFADRCIDSIGAGPLDRQGGHCEHRRGHPGRSDVESPASVHRRAGPRRAGIGDVRISGDRAMAESISLSN